MTSRFPRLAISSGEPAGIGPDVILSALQSNFAAELVVFSDPELLMARAKKLGIACQIELVGRDRVTQARPHQAGRILVYPISLNKVVTLGQADPDNASYVMDLLTQTGDSCLHHQFDGVVTAPVNKSIINQANIAFTGHTEFYADLAGVEQVVMLLATDDMRVALVTTHVALKKVADLITPQRLKFVIETTSNALRQFFAIADPQIAVAGLNPHAGEGGYLGQEELAVIEPVIHALNQQGLSIYGPFSADTMFVHNLDQMDAFIAMYHDQGLPVLKFHGFGRAVNITLGLPFIRTSVDHGTALELAGTGKADAGSLEMAIDSAIRMADNQLITANKSGSD